MTNIMTTCPRTAAVAATALLAACLMVGVSLAAQKPKTGAEFDKATAGMNRRAVAEYVFKTYECQGCHIATAEGSTGFTPRGNEARERFVGCVKLLTAVSTTLGADPKIWTADQRRKHQDFKDFGCTFCHAPSPGQMGFTAIGQKLGALHLGCVQVAQEVRTTGAK